MNFIDYFLCVFLILASIPNQTFLLAKEYHVKQ